MRIMNNLPALTAFTALNSTNKSLQKTIKSLSTGLRINSASDDAAGFAVSEKMRSQIRGLDIALRNSQDGISLLQTAEGALEQTNSMLQRMRDLSIQASNDSLTSNDRQYIQLEIDELKKQIDQIAGTTQFNKKRILDGSSGALWSSSDSGVKVRVNGGLTRTDNFGQKVSAEGNYRIEVKAKPGQAQVQKSSIFTTYKTETDYGVDAVPEDVEESVTTLVYDEVTETEQEIVPIVTEYEEPYTIFINGSNNGDTDPVDNAVNAINASDVEEIRAKWRYDSSTDTLKITGNGTFNIVGRLDGNGNSISTSTRIQVEPGLDDVNIFLTNVNIQNSQGPAIETSGAQVSLYLSGTNVIRSSYGPGIYNEPAGIQCLNVDGYSTKLTISSADGDGRTTGSLDARGAGCGAGIGGPCIYSRSIGTATGGISGTIGEIVINGGTIVAQGSSDGAGIGSGGCYNSYTEKPDAHVNITINGGNITATGGYGAAGIGSGASGSSRCNTNMVDCITIRGGTVNATGGSGAAGIGGGQYCNSGVITISDSADVTVEGYIAPENDVEAAIGRGQYGLIGDNDAVIYDYIDPELRDEIPSLLQIQEQSTIYELQEREYTRLIPRFETTTRTISIAPSPSLENELENVSLGESAASVTANGLPAGRYNVRAMSEPINYDCEVNLTGAYGFSNSVSNLLTLSAGFEAGLSNIETNASILFEVTDADASAGTVTLRATANLMSTDGITTKHVVRENIVLSENTAVPLSGLNLSANSAETEESYPAATLSLSSGAARNFQPGSKFVYSLTPSAVSEAQRTIEISGTQDRDWTLNWGGSVTDQPLRYSLDGNATADRTLTFSNFYLNPRDGTVYEGDIVLTTNGVQIENGADLASFDALRNNPVTTTYFSTADETTKLSETVGFTNPEGVFMLENPQTVTITQGNGKTASVTLYPTDTIRDVREKLNSAIAYGLGQGQYAQADKFVCYVTEESKSVQGLESVPGTFIVRSVIPGKDGELYFSGDEDLLNALGLNTIQESSESRFTAAVYDAHSGATINTMTAESGKFKSIIPPEIDIEIDPMTTAISANWDENTRRFIFAHNEDYMAMLHLKDNGITFHTGANMGEDFSIQLGDMSCFALGINGVNVTDRESASRSISTIDRAITRVSSQRAKIGAYINGLEHTMTNLTTTTANLTEAESRIRDTDMAQTMMDFVKLQILNQSGTSMLAQANQIPQSVMSLFN